MNYGMTKPPLGSVIDWGHPLSKGIVGCWLFNEGQGDIVNDISGNKNHGTLTNFSHPATTTSGWNPGDGGKQIKFTGNSNYILIKNNPSLQTNLISVFIKVKAVTVPNYNSLIGRWNSNTPTGNWLITLNQRIIVFINNGASTITVEIDYRNNYHIVGFVYDRSFMRVYIDGMQIGTPVNYTGAMGICNTDLIIGTNIDAPSGRTLNGSASFAYIYNRPFNSKEVLQLYQSPFCFIK